jgi:tetratricopeptide (TPR) repeat protein
MPTTVNGIGTHYYGKKDRSVRTAACHSCGRVGLLESYNTRLYFVVAFIPVIPLKRKRILDSCPSCRRHYAADADAYEQAKQLQVSGALDQFRREPSPEAALSVHGTLLGFHESDQAARFRETVRQRFPAEAELMTGLAAQLDQVSAFEQASELYEAAWRIQPDLPEARVGVARRKMALGELDEARRLLDFLETPGAGRHYALGPIDILSGHYQRQGRHEEALSIAAHLLREIPDAGQKHAFRAFVERSEKALGRFDSILPPREHSLRGLLGGKDSTYPGWLRWSVIGGAGLALLSAGLLINNEYIRRHRTIHVVNACGLPVQVRVDDQPPVTVATWGQVGVEEGRHRLQLSGPVEETREVDVRADFLDRWSCKPVWILNAGGEAALEEGTLYYAENPPPSQHRLILGQPFVSLRHVDYAFEDPPSSLDVKSKNGQVVKTSLKRFTGSDRDAFSATVQSDRAAAIDFAERRLRRKPDQDELLDRYLSQATPQDIPRIEAFLKSNLDYRPVQVQWHRAYQAVAEMGGHEDWLVAFYDGSLKTEPRNAALIYLRGRVDPDWNQQERYFRRAIAADPALPWPVMALGARAAAAGRWDDCLRDLNKARALKLGEDHVRDILQAASLATGSAKTMAIEYRSRLAANPLDFASMVSLIEMMAASGPPAPIEQEIAAWENRLPMEVRPQIVTPVRAIASYATGKLADCEQLCRRLATLQPSSLRLHAMLAQKRAKEAADDASFGPLWDDPWNALAVSLGLELEGRKDEAARWRERAIVSLEKTGPEMRRAATVLRAAQPPGMDELSRILLGSDKQALICALLAERFPARQAELRAAAARFNVRRKPPYQLVRLAIERTTTAAQ